VFGRHARYPLYSGLAGALAGCVLSAALGLAGSVEVLRQIEAGFMTLRGACTWAAGVDAEPCQAMRSVDDVLTERVALLLVMQGICFVLVAGGAWFMLARAHRVLVRRLPGAFAMTSPPGAGRGHDEIEQLVHGLEELTARQAGVAAERQWEQQRVAQRVRHDTRALQTLHEVTRMFSEADVSEFSLLNALALLESALDAHTVALRLDNTARLALGTSAVVCTHGAPALLDTLSLERGALEISARMVPPKEGSSGALSLVVPVSRNDVPVGTLVAEFAPGAVVEDRCLQLAESFAGLVALAVVSVSRSQEERRVALMEERGAIAAELHDSLAQSLAYMKIQVARLQSSLALQVQPFDITQAADELRSGLTIAYGEVRELIAAFRVRMGPGGLVAAVHEAIDEFSQRSALDLSFDDRLGRCLLQVNEEFHVLQVIREALSNAVRHARAERVWVAAVYGPGHELVVTVEDDGGGPGSAPSDTAHHYGLSIMRERTRTLNGEIGITARPGGGTCVRLSFAPQRLPMHAPDVVGGLT